MCKTQLYDALDTLDSIRYCENFELIDKSRLTEGTKKFLCFDLLIDKTFRYFLLQQQKGEYILLCTLTYHILYFYL